MKKVNLDSKSHVYLTGGTGFVGSHLRSTFAERDVPVTLLVRENSSVKTEDNEQIQRGDVTLPETLSLHDHDTVIHLAAQTNIEVAVDEPRRTWEVNADGTLNVLEAARNANVDRILFASTASVYGPPEYIPIDELHPTNPVEPYGASKLAGEALTHSYGSSYGMETLVIRLFNTFGPGQSEDNVIPTIVSQLVDDDKVELGNLSPSRDFIYVEDAVTALLTVLKEGESGTSYNVGRGESVSIENIANMVSDAVGRDPTIVSKRERRRSDDIEIPEHVADISRTTDLGWSPDYDVKEGISEMISVLNQRSGNGL